MIGFAWSRKLVISCEWSKLPFQSRREETLMIVEWLLLDTEGRPKMVVRECFLSGLTKTDLADIVTIRSCSGLTMSMVLMPQWRHLRQLEDNASIEIWRGQRSGMKVSRSTSQRYFRLHSQWVASRWPRPREEFVWEPSLIEYCIHSPDDYWLLYAGAVLCCINMNTSS